jgi:putative hydrolase of the HAD superfamily
MNKIKNIKGIIFDYGGTLDTNATHWSEVIWEAYLKIGIPVEKRQFRDAYVQGERYLAKPNIVETTDTFYEVLLKKSIAQIDFLRKKNLIPDNETTQTYPNMITDLCYQYAVNTTKRSEIVLKELRNSYPLILVTNFYGNINSVLENFHLLCYFDKIIESAKVDVRKPDPHIFELGVKALNAPPNEIVVIGDSLTNDILPAQKIGCHTIWLEGIGWEPSKSDVNPDFKVSSLSDIMDLL